MDALHQCFLSQKAFENKMSDVSDTSREPSSYLFEMDMIEAVEIRFFFVGEEVYP